MVMAGCQETGLFDLPSSSFGTSGVARHSDLVMFLIHSPGWTLG